MKDSRKTCLGYSYVLLSTSIFLFIILVLLAGCSSRPSSPINITTPNGLEVMTVPLVQSSLSFAVTEDAIWIATGGLSTHKINKIDPNSGRVIMEIPLDKQGFHPLIIDGDSIWITGGSVLSPSLYLINATNGKAIDELPYTGKIVLGDGAIWVSDFNNKRIIRVSTQTAEVVAEISLTITPSFLAFGEGALWVLDHKKGLLIKVDPKANKVVAEIIIGEAYSFLLGSEYSGLAVGGGGVWISDSSKHNVICLDTSNNTVVARIPTFGTHPIGSHRRARKDPLPLIMNNPSMFSGEMPGAITFGNGFVWVATLGNNSIKGGNFILKIDPNKRLPVEEIWLPNKSQPIALGLSRHAVWALHFLDAEMTKIGLIP